MPVISWNWSIKGWYFRIDIQGHDLYTAGFVDVADVGVTPLAPAEFESSLL